MWNSLTRIALKLIEFQFNSICIDRVKYIVGQHATLFNLRLFKSTQAHTEIYKNISGHFEWGWAMPSSLCRFDPPHLTWRMRRISKGRNALLKAWAVNFNSDTDSSGWCNCFYSFSPVFLSHFFPCFFSIPRFSIANSEVITAAEREWESRRGEGEREKERRRGREGGGEKEGREKKHSGSGGEGKFLWWERRLCQFSHQVRFNAFRFLPGISYFLFFFLKGGFLLDQSRAKEHVGFQEMTYPLPEWAG